MQRQSLGGVAHASGESGLRRISRSAGRAPRAEAQLRGSETHRQPSERLREADKF